MNIKPIETIYRGYRFRSRLEARWGVFFDKLGISWEYEKEGYSLNGVWYLPDFWLPDQQCFVEIKGEWKPCSYSEGDEVAQKAHLLALASGHHVYVFAGSSFVAINLPGMRGEFCHHVHYPWKGMWATVFFSSGGWYSPCVFVQCRRCGRIAIICLLDSINREMPCNCYKDSDALAIDFDLQYADCLIAAYTASRQARFEHSERG